MFHGRIEPAPPIPGAPPRARRSWLVLGAATVAILMAPGTPARAQGARKAPAESRGSASTRKKPEKPALPVDEGKEKEKEKEKDPVHEEFLKVNYLFNRELYDLAIPRYEAILQANPGYARSEAIHHALALSHYNLAAKGTPRSGKAAAGETAPGAEGDPRTAHLRKTVHHLKEALKKKEFEPRLESTRLLGQCLLLLQDGANAAKTFQWVLERSPRGKESAAAAIGLGEALAMQSRHSEAATAFRKALELGPEDDERERAEYHLALALARSGDAAAEAEGAKVLDRLAGASGPYADDARYMKASVRQSRGDDAGAIEDFAKLVEAGSSEYEEAARFGLGTALLRAGRHAEAADALKKLLDRFPQGARKDLASVYLARALIESGKAGAGLKMLQDLRASPSAGGEASLWLARMLVRHGKSKNAVPVLEAALGAGARGTSKDALELELASALLADGQFDAAGEALSRFEAAHRESGSAHSDQVAYLKAYALHRAGKHAASLEACARFANDHPRSPLRKEAAALAAENHFLANDHEKALSAYGAYLEEFDTALDGLTKLKGRFRMAQAMYLAGRPGEAMKALEALDPAALGEEAERAFREDVLFATHRYVLGDAAYRLKDHARAQKELAAFLEDPRLEPAGLTAEANDARFKLAHALQLSGDLAGARAAFVKALRTDPKSPHAEQILFELGQIAYGEKDMDAAAQAFAKVASRGRDSRFAPHALRFLGWIAYEKKDYARAAESYEKLATTYPEHELAPDAEYHLALSLQGAGRREEAARALERFRAKRPGDPRLARILLQEAIQLGKDGKHDAALASLEKLRKEKGGEEILPSILYETAWCHRGRKDLDAARAAYGELIALEHAGELGATARLELAELEFDEKNHSRALEVLEPLARPAGQGLPTDPAPGRPADPVPGTPTDPALREKVLYRIVWTRHMLGDAAGTLAAEDAFRKEFPSSPLALELSVLAAKAHLAKGDPAKAGAIFLSITEAKPGSPEAEAAELGHAECLAEDAFRREFPSSPLALELSVLAAKAHLAKGDPAKAGAIFLSITEAKPGSPEAEAAELGHAECLAEERKFAESRKRFEAFLGRHPGSPSAYRARFGIAWAAENTGRHDEAIKLYREVARETATPTGARAQFQIGQCLVAKKDHRDAIAEFLQVAAGYRYPEWTSRALLQAAGCFEALGDAENARKYYEEVVTEYPGRDEARLARERISKLETSSP